MIRSEFFNVNGSRIEAVRYGASPDRAPTLVFLHEGLGCVGMWRDFPYELAESCGCGAFVYSRLGYGRSDPCPLPRGIDYMHREALEVLPAVMEAAGIERSILIGHSDGGSIAIIYAGSRAEGSVQGPGGNLLGLITEAAHVFCEEISVRSIREAGKAYLKGDLRDKLEKYHGPNTDCAFWGWNRAWLDPEFIHWNIEGYLPGIRMPMLALQGKEDQYGTAAQVESIEEKTEPKANVLMLPDCRHAPHIDQREAAFEAMKNFILQIKDRI
jgi:pimeloyl-ACP methyl ester carboxylesterase